MDNSFEGVGEGFLKLCEVFFFMIIHDYWIKNEALCQNSLSKIFYGLPTIKALTLRMMHYVFSHLFKNNFYE